MSNDICFHMFLYVFIYFHIDVICHMLSNIFKLLDVICCQMFSKSHRNMSVTYFKGFVTYFSTLKSCHLKSDIGQVYMLSFMVDIL